METATLTPTQNDKRPSQSAALKKIEKQLLTLAQKASLLWQQMAVLMIQVEEESLWESEAKSFTAWVKDMASKSGVQESMLWRYLRAGRYYTQLRESPDPELAAMPALGEAPCKAAPESLELLDKISKAAPPKEAADLAKSTLAGESTREELREAWQDYKAAMPAAPSEAGDGEPPAANAASAQAGAILQALRKSRGHFIARDACHQWTLHVGVTVDADPFFNAVGIELATPEQPRPGLHGVQIVAGASDLEPEPRWADASDYVDSLWLVVPAALSQQAQGQTPEWVGVLSYQDSPADDAEAGGGAANRLQVARPAGARHRQADLRGELALELLKRLR